MRGTMLRNALVGSLILGLGLIGCESQPTSPADAARPITPDFTQTIGAGGRSDTTGITPQGFGGEIDDGRGQTIGAGGD
jgi:hypothetical protein